MADNDPRSPRYWLLLGTPKGPYTSEEIRNRVSSGAMSPETPICEVGADVWVTVSQWLASALVPVPSSSNGAGTPARIDRTPPASESVPASTPARKRPAIPRKYLSALVIVIAIGASLYGLVEWLRMSTPRGVGQRALESRTAAEMKKYSSVEMHPQIDAVFPKNPNGDPLFIVEFDDGKTLTLDTVVILYFHGTRLVPDSSRRQPVGGIVTLIRTKGWKVNGINIDNIDGNALQKGITWTDLFSKPEPESKARAQP